MKARDELVPLFWRRAIVAGEFDRPDIAWRCARIALHSGLREQSDFDSKSDGAQVLCSLIRADRTVEAIAIARELLAVARVGGSWHEWAAVYLLVCLRLQGQFDESAAFLAEHRLCCASSNVMVIQAIAVLKEELAKHLGWDVARAQLAADSGSLTLYNQGCLAAVRGDNRKALDLIVAAVRGQRLTELRGTMLDPDLASIREQAALVAAIAEREAELLNKR